MIAAVLLTAALQLAGPGTPVAGRAVRVVGSDTLPAAGAVVVLHRVTTTKSGPVDSTESASDGRFRLAIPADSGAIFLLSARWHGVEYFAPPLDLDPAARTTSVRLVVADTSAAAPVGVASRSLVIGAPAPDGTRNAVDLLILDNPGSLTRVARDSATPTWRLRLPPHVVNITIGESDFGDEALHLHEDTLEVLAAIPPGQRQLMLQYQLPPSTRQLRVPFAEAVGAANVLLEEVDADVEGALARSDTAVVEGRRYTRWSGALPEGSEIGIRFGAGNRLPGWVLELVAGLFALALVGMAFYSARQATHGRPETAPTPLDDALDAVARLDAAHVGRQAEMGDVAWSAYLAERERLKEAARALLPSSPRPGRLPEQLQTSERGSSEDR